MPEAWEVTSTDLRSENQIITFIIFCEDQNDEPYYFRSFEIANKIKINCIPNQRKAKLNLLSTLKFCDKEGLLEFKDEVYKLKDGITENIWCVYDRDLECINLEEIKKVDDLNFTTAITTAQSAGIKVAWSNDAFELWILLHFEPISHENKLHRSKIYERLTEILKLNENIRRDYQNLIDDGTFSYKLHLKKRLAFLTHVLPLLKENTSVAIKNAEILEKQFKQDIPFHDCNPCTKVHYLVQDLIAN